MSRMDPKRATELALAFSGKITASVTHEVNNVMAIVRELSGLIEDLLYGAESSGQINLEKLKIISEKITYQTKRGESIIKRLNRFAHTADVPPRGLDLKSLLLDMIELCQRFAMMKNVTLSADLPEEQVEVESNPFLLHNAVFLCIMHFMDSSEDGGTITVGFEKSESGVEIVFTGPEVKDTDLHAAEHAFLSYLVTELNGALELFLDENARNGLRLHLPIKYEDNKFN